MSNGITITAASYHRNGICGVGFYAILFNEKNEGAMVASLFDAAGYCAIYKIAELSAGNIAFANGNSWRGDVYEEKLRPLLKDFLAANGGNRLGPFALPV